MVQVVAYRAEVHLQFGAVRVLLPAADHALQAEVACAFHQHHGAHERLRFLVAQQGIGVHMEVRARREMMPMCGDRRPHADHVVHFRRGQVMRHALVQQISRKARSQHVAQYHHAPTAVRHVRQVVQGDTQRGGVVAVAVVDERTSLRAFHRTHAHVNGA